ncbi:MAG: permease [Bacteroidota bacterium]
MDIISLLQYTFGKVIETFSHNWYLLLLSIVISAALKLYVDQAAVGSFLRRNSKNSVLVSTAVAVATPFCSCGTTAVILGMIASTIPWAPIVAFMVASPLTSPQELFYSAGLFGWDFATAFFVASIVLGLIGGAIASLAESRGWLKNQARIAAPKAPDRTAMVSQPVPLALPMAMPATGEMTMACCGSASLALPVLPHPVTAPAKPLVTPSTFMAEMLDVSKRLLPLFFGFTFIGYLLNSLIPAAWITGLFGTGHAYSIPLAATLGLPFYINTEASLPLVRAMLDSGMSQGAALAFLITGAGTSIGAIGGALTIARWRVIAIVIATLWAGSILMGYAYNFFVL